MRGLKLKCNMMIGHFLLLTLSNGLLELDFFFVHFHLDNSYLVSDRCENSVGLTPPPQKHLQRVAIKKRLFLYYNDLLCSQVDNVDCALIVYFSALYCYFVAVVVWLIQLLEINKVTLKT